MLTAVQLLRVVKEKGQTLSDLTRIMTKYPQLLTNVPVKNKEGWDQNSAIRSAVESVEKALGNEGRVLVRPSGTESLIRVMAERPGRRVIEEICESNCGRSPQPFELKNNRKKKPCFP